MGRAKGLIITIACILASCLAGCTSASPTSSKGTHESESSDISTPVVYDTPAGEGAAEPDDSTLAGMMSAGNVSSIRVLGDSITAGYLIEGFDGPSDTGTIVYQGGEGTYYETPTTVRCWTNRFRTYANEHGVESFVNAGVSGFRMQYLAEEPDAWLAEGADVIVVMLGTNDAAKESVEDFSMYAEQALDAAEERCRHLVVVSPPDNQRTDAVNLYGMDQIDATLSTLCEQRGWEHISLRDALTVGTDDFFPDEVHPTEQGSDKLWEAFHDRLGLA